MAGSRQVMQSGSPESSDHIGGGGDTSRSPEKAGSAREVKEKPRILAAVDDLLAARLGGDADDKESNPKVPGVRAETC